MFKNIIKIFIIAIVFVVFISCTNCTYARNITYEAKKLYAFDGIPYNTEYPAIIYRTFVSAAQSTINRYYCENISSSKCLDLASDGWAYVQGENKSQTNLDYLVVQKDANGNIIMPGAGPSKTTFRSWSTFFHPYENTSYVGNSGSFRYNVHTSSASEGDYEPQNITEESTGYIEGETSNYKGIYDHAAIYGQTGSLIPDDGSRYKNGIYEILEDNNFLWRMHVRNHTTFVSDMIISPSHYEYIYNLFSSQIDNGEYIYMSSNTYSDHGRITGMDTAYKFYKNLSWWGGRTIYGGEYPAWDSFINYYDNKIIFPRTSSTTIYIRHIDVTGESKITSEIANSKSWISKFKKVGYGHKNYTTPVFPTYDPNYKEYQEKFVFQAKDLEENDIITVYNKLYNETTRTSTDGGFEVDSTDYNGYSLVGTVVGIGTNMVEATQNRDSKYDNLNELQVRETVDVFGDDLGKYIVIDFLYEKVEPKVYIRHIDTTGIDTNNFNSTTVSNYAYGQAYSEEGRYIKNVGFAERTNNPSSRYRIQDTPTAAGEELEYEYYELSYNDLTQNGGARFYNKLYSDATKKSTYGRQRDNTNYKDYYYGYNNNIKCVVAQGNSKEEAIKNRDQKIDNKEFSTNNYLDFNVNDIEEPYIFIDFYYRNNKITTEEPKLLVRHINVTGMEEVDYKTIDNFVKNGSIGTDIYDGYNQGLGYGSNNFLTTRERGKVRYKNTGIYYNEIYTLSSSNTTYRLYNEFYGQQSDYQYIGYMMSYNNYALDIAELLRDNKINNINFNNLNTLDGRARKRICECKSRKSKVYSSRYVL